MIDKMKDVLIIHENVAILYGLEKVLKDLRYQVNITNNCKQGLESFRKKLHPIVIADLFTCGYEMIHQIKSVNDNTHIIIIDEVEDNPTLTFEVVKFKTHRQLKSDIVRAVNTANSL